MQCSNVVFLTFQFPSIVTGGLQQEQKLGLHAPKIIWSYPKREKMRVEFAEPKPVLKVSNIICNLLRITRLKSENTLVPFWEVVLPKYFANTVWLKS